MAATAAQQGKAYVSLPRDKIYKFPTLAHSSSPQASIDHQIFKQLCPDISFCSAGETESWFSRFPQLAQLGKHYTVVNGKLLCLLGACREVGSTLPGSPNHRVGFTLPVNPKPQIKADAGKVHAAVKLVRTLIRHWNEKHKDLFHRGVQHPKPARATDGVWYAHDATRDNGNGTHSIVHDGQWIHHNELRPNPDRPPSVWWARGAEPPRWYDHEDTRTDYLGFVHRWNGLTTENGAPGWVQDGFDLTVMNPVLR